jgi:tetratricopeptide (TPR) repeat protein
MKDPLPRDRLPSRRRQIRSGAPMMAFAAALLGCAARGKSTDDTTAQKYYEIAVGSFHNGLVEDAKLQLERALTAAPGHADSHYLRGVLFLQEGKALVDALEIQRCLEDAAADAQRERADDLHRQAHVSFAKAAELYPDTDGGRGRSYNSMAVVSLFFGDHVRAISEAKQALGGQFYNERYSALANLGWAYYGQGKLTEAMTELRQAVLINPDYCVGHYRLGQVYLDAGMVTDAVEEASRVTAANRCPIQDAHRLLGAAQLRLGQVSDATGAFESCVALAPRSCLAGECRTLLSGPGGGGAG